MQSTELTIAPAVPADAGELLTVQRAAYLAEGERYGTFRIPPLTETPDEVRAAITSEGTDLGVRPSGSGPGLAYLEKIA